jgi:hypothetical protein
MVNQRKIHMTRTAKAEHKKYNERSLRDSTVKQVSYRGNLCENADDETKIGQRNLTIQFIKKLFPFRHIRTSLKSLSLDTVAHHTVVSMEQLGLWKNTVVEYNLRTAQKHIDDGIDTIVGDLSDVIEQCDEKFSIVNADSESGPKKMLKFFKHFIERECYASTCMLFMNVSGHGDKGNTHENYEKNVKKLIHDNSDKCEIIQLHHAMYKCHRDNKITRGAPMYGYWYSITKK